MNHVSVSPTDGNGPTQGQRKTLTRVGIEPTTFGLDLRRYTIKLDFRHSLESSLAQAPFPKQRLVMEPRVALRRSKPRGLV